MHASVVCGLLILASLGGWCVLQAPEDGAFLPRLDAGPVDRPPVRLAPGRRPAPLSVTAEPLPVTVSGQVLDPTGRPLAGARLRWVIDRRQVASARSDSQGRYAIRGPRLSGNLEVESGPQLRAVVWLYVENRDHVPVRLRRGEVLGGVVRGADGTPAAGARVSAGQEGFGRSETTTDTRGRFRLATIPVDGPFQVTVEAGRLGRITLDHVVWAPDAELEVDLPPVFSVRGRVIRGDPDGRGLGVPGLRVVSGIGHDTDGPGTRTGDAGWFVLEGLTEDGYLWVASDGWSRQNSAHLVEGGPEPTIRVVPSSVSVRTVRGRVVSYRGTPLAGVRVGARWAKAGLSDVDGFFVVSGLRRQAAGNVLWAAHEDCYGSLCVPGREDTHDVRLTLERRPSLRGRVIDQDGRPIPHADVDVEWVRKTPDATTHDSGCDISATTGAFHVVQLMEYPATVTIQVAGYVTEVREGVVPRVGGLDLGDVVLTGCIRRRGSVVDANGAPLPTASYRLYGAGNYRWMPVSADGSFEVDVAPDGRFKWLRVSAPGYLPQRVTPGGEGDSASFDVVLQRALVLGGRVVGPDGRPVPGARVRAWGEGSMTSEQGTWADLAGRFRLEVTEPGSYQAHVSDTDLCFARQQLVSTDDEEIVLRGVTPGRLAGNVVDLGGHPVVGVTVIARIRDTYDGQEVVTGEDGRFVLDGLKGVEFDVQVSDPPAGLGYRPLLAVPLGREDVWLAAEPTCTISGEVVWPDGRPAGEVDVDADPVGHAAVSGWCSTDERGLFVIEGLVRGSYRLDAFTTVEVDAETDEDHVGSAGVVGVETWGHRIVLVPRPD